jgi:hypothetical protein
MDSQRFLAINYPELAQVLEERPQGTIPEPQPLDISPWLAMSMLQKAIRRGETGHALRAAATLLRDAPDRLWRRLTVAVFEDVGLGSLDLVSPVLIATSAKGIRKQFGGDWMVASALVERMAQARKCRAADDAFMIAVSHPRYEADRLSLTYRTMPDLMDIVTGSDDIIRRTIALVYALGTDRCPIPTMRTRKGDYRYAFRRMLEAGFPHCVLELGERGTTRFSEPLPAIMSLVSRDVPARSTGYEPTGKDDDLRPAVMIGDVPAWAIDYYTRPGRAAMKAFLSRETATGFWIKSHVSKTRWLEFLGGLVFRVEGGLMRRRLQWPIGLHLQQMMMIEANGCGIEDASEALDLLRNDLLVLNEERANVL